MVDLITGLLLVAALWRRPECITVGLAAAYGLAVLAAHYRAHEALRPILIAIDCGVVVFMSWLWSRYRSNRARIVAAIGVSSIAFGIFAAAINMHWNAYAAASNAATLTQILVAGGMSDGIIAWLGNRVVRARSRLLGMFHNVAGNKWARK